MGNGAMAIGPQATAPILDSTTVDDVIGITDLAQDQPLSTNVANLARNQETSRAVNLRRLHLSG